MQATFAARLLDALTDEERATAKVSHSVDGNRVNTSIDYVRADGTRGRRGMSANLNPNSDPPRLPGLALPASH